MIDGLTQLEGDRDPETCLANTVIPLPAFRVRITVSVLGSGK